MKQYTSKASIGDLLEQNAIMTVQQKDKILEMVREQLQRPNPPDTNALYGRAVRIDDGVRELTLRQFNARYPLQVRREMAKGREKAVGGQRSEEVLDGTTLQLRRDAVKTILLDFAREVADKQSRPEMIDFIESGVHEYVNEITAALQDVPSR